MKNKILLFVSFICTGLLGQSVIGVDTLRRSGPINKRINLVLMGDGYITSQIPQYVTDATTVSSYLLNTAPFNRYQNYFNVYAIKCVSPQSGVTHAGTATDVTEPASPILNVTNYFDTQFDNYNIHRLIYSNNQTNIYSVLAANFPNYDQVVILGNSTEYGGAGGAYAVSSVNSNSKEIVAHEIGHSFAGLADEYWAGASYAVEKPNMTADNSSSIKWAPWLGINSIGAYAYGTAAPDNGWYRPHQNCKMRYLGSPYCAVCAQTIIEKIHSLTNPIDVYTPDNTGAVGAQWFKAKLIQPNPNTLKRSWTLNSTIIANNIDSVLINAGSLPTGNNIVTLTVIDTTVLTKDISHAALHTFATSWSVNKNILTGLEEVKAQLEFSMYPNPASTVINLKYNVLEAAQLNIAITDLSGKAVIKVDNAKTPAGQYVKEIDVKELTEGIYFLSISINGQTTNTKFVIFK